MKTLLLIMVLLSVGAAAKDGASIYKTKCAGCHGAQGEGKIAPKLAGTSLSEEDIVNLLTKGGQPKAPHTKAFRGANKKNAERVAAYVKTLK